MKVEFLGHSSFLIQSGGYTLLTDPFLKYNPLAVKGPGDIKATHILVSHGHNDHIGDTIEIAKASESVVYATFELANQLANEGLNVRSGHLGGRLPAEFGSVKFFQALHGSGVPGGHACGFIIEIEGKRIYFAGDTALLSDMAFLEDENIDLALLPIGSVFTMGPEDALKAVKLIKPKYVIPMHYNTFPPIMQDPARFKEAVENKTKTKVKILNPGEVFEL